MLEEYIDYNQFSDININLINLIEKYKENKNNLENKIKKIEQDYNYKLNEIMNNTDIIKNIKKLNSLEILKKESELIQIILTYSLSNNLLEVDFLNTSLEYLLELSNILKNRLKQKTIENNDTKDIVRCSYKFCTFKENCNYYYNKKSNQKCYQDHFVHNMVSHDIINLLKFIKNNDSDTIQQNKEILKSLNTLSYVINHMENELNSKCMYLEESEVCQYHK